MSDLVALIPVLDEPGVLERLTTPLAGRGALAHTFTSLRRDLPDTTIIMTTDSETLCAHVKSEFPFVRVHNRTRRDYVGSLVDALDILPTEPRSVLVLEATHPFRPAGMLTKLAQGLVNHAGMDSVVCVRQIKGMLWRTGADGEISPAQEPDDPSPPIFFQEVVGLGLATRPALLRQGRRLGDNVGFEVLDDIWSLADLRDDRGVRRAQSLASMLSEVE